MKFNQLSDRAKVNAIADYIDGWNETADERGDDRCDLELLEVYDILNEDTVDEMEYDKQGNSLGHPDDLEGEEVNE